MISSKEDEKNDNKKNETIEERKRVEKLKSKAEKEAKKVRTTFYSFEFKPLSKPWNPYLDITIQWTQKKIIFLAIFSQEEKRLAKEEIKLAKLLEKEEKRRLKKDSKDRDALLVSSLQSF